MKLMQLVLILFCVFCAVGMWSCFFSGDMPTSSLYGLLGLLNALVILALIKLDKD